ncbi:beta-mannosidase [Candidatus Thermokryptus mobilis]|uniref:Beta-mannosidase B n=1 Tax=Candidatus Thermokryptus mobilis TaxID=1643428 RepID=A0A0S4MW29_9BACT|nr:glycoside hydrolase family 2 protein [Candidatus Thermokryptus mobilis]CUU03246.1 beta-mannosidase [Candidatus Thermokryptus mobilis]
MKKIIDLNGEWEFKVCSESFIPDELKRKLFNWQVAFVPGVVHLDLLRSGLIPDPFFETNENLVQWVDKVDWVYRKRFIVDFDFSDFHSVKLTFEGLDTVGTVKLNGLEIGSFENMFISYSFDVKGNLNQGENEVEVVFKAPTFVAKELENKYGKLLVELASHRVYLRKAQYSFGWDWGPILTTSGIWKPVYIEFLKFARIKNVWFKTVSISSSKADIFTEIEIEKFTDDDIDLVLTVLSEGEKIYERKFVQKGGDRVRGHRFEIYEPRLWFPSGYGEQALYNAVVEIFKGGELIDRVEKKFGIRTVRLIQEKDEDGESFIFEVNGEKIFCKGANWIPADSFLPRVRKDDYDKLLEMAKEANLNMLRVWGGGIYEDDYFYEKCDELGIMIWQDFMFACASYPEFQEFIENVKNEAIQVVKRLRNHPSIVIWCGNNENEWIWVDKTGKSPDEMPGASIFNEILPSVCDSYDGTRPYWRSSPWGKNYPNSETDGNHHQWKVWSGWLDYKNYEFVKARFITEFGFQSPPHVKTLNEVIKPENRDFNSPSIHHRNKQVEGIERLFRFLIAHHKVVSDFEELIYRMQLNQAEAIKFAVENWRVRKFKTSGTIFWQWNDPWPVISWSAIDYKRRPKALYFFAKKFFSPVLLVIKKVEDRAQIFIVNDLLNPISCGVIIKTMTTRGEVKFFSKFNASVRGNDVALALDVPLSELKVEDFKTDYIYAKLEVDGSVIAENSLYLTEPKFLKLKNPGLRYKLIKSDEETLTLRITSSGLAKSVFINFENGDDIWLSDNFFDVHPSATVEIKVKSNKSVAELLRSLRIKYLT